MIYSYFTFNDEFKLLDLKIAEERNHVDRFIIVEAARTFTNISKPTYLTESGLYKDDPQVDILVVPDFFFDRLDTLGCYFPFFDDTTKDPENRQNNIDTWKRLAIQTNYPLAHYKFQPEDVLMYGCVDEIIPSQDMSKWIDEIKKHGFMRPMMNLYMYKINIYAGTWGSVYGMTGQYYKETGIADLYRLRKCHERNKTIPSNGKHFSYMMTGEEIVNKMKSIAGWYDGGCPTDEDIMARIKERGDPFGRTFNGVVPKYEPVPIDETWPKTILDNIDDWKDYIECEV